MQSEVEPPYQTDSEELMKNLSHSYLPNFKLSKSECINMNLGIDQEPKCIQVYKGMEESKYEQWFQFFKHNMDAFAWTYKDLRVIPPNVSEH